MRFFEIIRPFERLYTISYDLAAIDAGGNSTQQTRDEIDNYLEEKGAKRILRSQWKIKTTNKNAQIILITLKVISVKETTAG